MDIKKRDFLFGARRRRPPLRARLHPAQAQIPPGVPKATGRTMLDSPNYFGTASKGGGFKQDLGPHPAAALHRRSQLQAAPHQQGDRAVGRQPGRLL